MNLEHDPFDEPFENLETLADRISETLQCPVTIEDANHRLLAYSFHDLQTDPARIATIIGRRVPESVINSLWKEGVIQRLLSGDEPIHIPSIQDVGLGSRVAISIRKNQEVLGYIWVVETRPLSSHAFHVLKKAAQTAKAKLMQLQIRKQKQEEGYQEFFWRLLTGSFPSDAAIEEEAQKLALSLARDFQILVLDFKQPIDPQIRQKIQYVIKTNQKVKIVLTAVDRSQLILLVNPPLPATAKQDISAFVQNFVAQMWERFEVSSITPAVGTLYRDHYTKVENSYQEALTVLQMKDRYPSEIKPLLHYEDLGFYRYIPVLHEFRKQHKSNHPAIQKLQEYDRLHHSNLLETLFVYLVCDSNIKEAADRLHIHTNTLAYRLARMAEIADIQLKDMDQKVGLYLEFRLIQLEQK
ncbi:helix-turn-helix domain-containing protein [Fodinisporobacter ferrooxydans]|uniref:Helix-turn-helix domain-containing protein n=1 Tax=Fodinisporobacter ferrooxydans TaxID=2901836 RepID=A0ABY4CID7_9BACL|nr:helix-turn-helix domain-containing protein [Alicyclobacillaceae bacterium MYW30-H2]